MPSSNRYELLKLEHQLCFALYAATRAITRTYREKLGPIGLTYPQYLVLTVLWETDALTISDLGDRLMLDSGTLTPLVKRLESMRLVTRKRRIEDEREVEVCLTAKGLEMRELAIDVRKHVVQCLDMSEAEIGKLRGSLMGMIDQLDHTTPARAAEPVDA